MNDIDYVYVYTVDNHIVHVSAERNFRERLWHLRYLRQADVRCWRVTQPLAGSNFESYVLLDVSELGAAALGHVSAKALLAAGVDEGYLSKISARAIIESALIVRRDRMRAARAGGAR